MTRAQKSAVKAFAAEVRHFFAHNPYHSVDISAIKYGLSASPEVLTELEKSLPDVRIASVGFMGYISFDRQVNHDERYSSQQTSQLALARGLKEKL